MKDLYQILALSLTIEVCIKIAKLRVKSLNMVLQKLLRKNGSARRPKLSKTSLKLRFIEEPLCRYKFLK